VRASEVRIRRFLAWCGAFMLVACGGVLPSADPTESASISETDPNLTPSPQEVPLPTLPPLGERYPELFDENGCARISPLDDPGLVDCGPSSPLPEDLIEPPPDASRVLLGFEGPFYATEVSGEGVVVLEQTVTVATDGPWGAWGLIRNETLLPVGGVQVIATLLGDEGKSLDVATAAAPVDPLRPGEPGPFALSSDVPAADVSVVEWAVVPGPPNPTGNREADIYQNWWVPWGDREPIDFGYQDPPGGPPYPFVLSGGLRSLSERSMIRPVVVVAWLNKSDRVIWVETARVDLGIYPPPDDIELSAGGVGGFFLVVEEADPARLFTDVEAGIHAMLWAMGS
jgi:hypothetical protein